MNALHYATALLEPQTTFILEAHNLTHFIYLSYDAPLPHFISSCARHAQCAMRMDKVFAVGVIMDLSMSMSMVLGMLALRELPTMPFA